jgi:hypothetical protein
LGDGGEEGLTSEGLPWRHGLDEGWWRRWAGERVGGTGGGVDEHQEAREELVAAAEMSEKVGHELSAWRCSCGLDHSWVIRRVVQTSLATSRPSTRLDSFLSIDEVRMDIT